MFTLLLLKLALAQSGVPPPIVPDQPLGSFVRLESTAHSGDARLAEQAEISAEISLDQLNAPGGHLRTYSCRRPCAGRYVKFTQQVIGLLHLFQEP